MMFDSDAVVNHQSLIVRMISPRLAIAATLLVLCAGCNSDDAQLSALRDQLMLPEEPAAAATVSEAKATAASDRDVVVVGRIVDDEIEAFVPGQAVFLIAEILPGHEGHGGKDHVDNCPFCKRRAAKAPRAAVQCVDESGKPLDVDARKLFAVQPGDTVVVRGKGEVQTDLDVFQITADGIYVRTAAMNDSSSHQ